MQGCGGTIIHATGRSSNHITGTVIESDRYTNGHQSDTWIADKFTPIPPPNQKPKHMTKCTVIGQEPVHDKKKAIEFVKLINTNGIVSGTDVKPTKFDNIELICSDFGGHDLMFAYDHNRNLGYLYLGHWNDGVAE